MAKNTTKNKYNLQEIFNQIFDDTNFNIASVLEAAIDRGVSIYKAISAASTNAANVKASQGVILGGYLSNIAAYQVYVKLYDKATSPVVGTDTPVNTFTIQANQSTPLNLPPEGIQFSNGISIAITKFEADSDTTAVGANDCVVNLFYK